MKQYHEVDVQAASPSEMRSLIKENSAAITKLNGSIRKKRSEMKQFSEEMTKLLEKKLIPKNESQYSHPNFNPQFTNPHNQSLHIEKQSIYLQITKLKQQISELLAQEEPQIVNQIRKKEAVLQNLIKEEARTVKEKMILEEALGKNKEILENFKESQCLKEIEQNEQQLENIKKQIKDLDKDLKLWMDEQIKMGMYTGEAEKGIEEIENRKEIVQEIDSSIIDGLIEEIHKIVEQRKIVDREFMARKEEINRKIKDIVDENSKLDREIRYITNLELQKELERKKKEIITRNKSLPQIAQIERKSKNKPVKVQEKEKLFYSPSLLLTQPEQTNERRLKKKEEKAKEPETIVIGNWRSENHIKDDIIETRNIARAVSMKIRTKEKKITGIGVTYIDKRGVEVLGRSNIWKLDQDKIESGEEEYVVDLEDVVALYYYSPNSISNANPGSSSIIGLKFMSKSSRPVIKIGQFLNEEEIQFIQLENQYIKTVQFTLDNSYKSISGIRLCLQKIGQSKNKKNVFQQDEEENPLNMEPSGLKKEIKNEQMMPSKWLTTTSQAGLTQKKVFVKNQAFNKKLNDVPQVDHRLMLNRKKKMV